MMLTGIVTSHWWPVTPKLDSLAMVAGMEPVMVVGTWPFRRRVFPYRSC